MNVKEIIDVTRSLPPDEKRQVLLALEADVRALEDRSPEDDRSSSEPSSDVRAGRLEWLKNNRHHYGGNYVVLDGITLIGTAASYREGRELALAKGVNDAFVDYLPAIDEVGEMGGW